MTGYWGSRNNKELEEDAALAICDQFIFRPGCTLTGARRALVEVASGVPDVCEQGIWGGRSRHVMLYHH